MIIRVMLLLVTVVGVVTGDSTMVWGEETGAADHKVNVNLIQRISKQTGGSSRFISRAGELPQVMIRLAAKAQGYFPIKTITSSIDVGGQVTDNVFIDSFTTSALFSLNWQEGDLNLTLIRPDGSQVGPTDGGVEFADEANHEFYRIASPDTGTWQIVIDAVDTSLTQDFILQVFSKNFGVQFTAMAEDEQVSFPDPVLIQAIVIGDSAPVAKASVSGEVIRPDGSKINITLYDDGLAGHGDDKADDGLYSNFFAQYSQDGVYTFKLRVNNQNGVAAILPEEEGPDFVPYSIAPFERESTVSVSVSGVPAVIQPATLELALPQTIPPDTTITMDILDQVILGITLTAGPEENVMINSIAFNGSGTGDETAIVQIKLYGDGDKDGYIDLFGKYALPIITGTYDKDNGQVTFTNPLTLSAGTSVNLLLVYEIKINTTSGTFRAAISPNDVSAIGLTSNQAISVTGETLISSTLTVKK